MAYYSEAFLSNMIQVLLKEGPRLIARGDTGEIVKIILFWANFS